MKRLTKLGGAYLAVAALFALVGAASASASGFVSENSPVNYQGVEVGSQTLNFYGGSASCSGTIFSSGSVLGKSESMTVTPTSPNCNFISGSHNPLELNGCKFIFHPGPELSPGKFGGTVDIGPSGCGPMTFDWTLCKTTFYPKNGLEAEYVNAGTGKSATVEVYVKALGLEYNSTGWGPCDPGKKQFNGQYFGRWTVSAKNSGGSASGVSVVKNLPVGLFLSGKESTEEAAQPKIAAESYPVTIRGEQKSTAKHALKVGGSPLACPTVEFQSSLSGPGNAFTAASNYGGDCTWALGLYSTIIMNSCKYVFHVSNVGPPYAGTTDIACSIPGDAIQLRAWAGGKKGFEKGEAPLCSASIGAQNGLGGVGFTNVGEIYFRGVDLGLNLKGIKYTYTNGSFLCPYKSGSYEDGTYTGTSTLAVSP